MNTQVQSYLEMVETAQAQEYKNLVMVPLVSTYKDTNGYLLLDEALERGSIRVTEIDNEGSVPDLKVLNNSDQKILILDGEELVGAKQNRIVNTSILLAPGSETKIPVSCVEQGRWTRRSDQFYSEKRMSPSYMRKNKSEQVEECLFMGDGFRSDQGKIWREIRERQTRRSAASSTGEISELYKKDRSLLNKYLKKFKTVDNQVGSLFMINDEIVGLDSFGRSETLSKVFSKLVESYAVDALDLYREGTETNIVNNGAEKFIQECVASESEEHPSVALGTDCRLTSEDIIGSALVFDNHVFHMSLFSRRKEQGQNNHRSSFSRMSQRRRYRFDD